MLKYIIIIGIILGIVFASQFMYSNEFTKNFADNATGQLKKYMASGSNWVAANVYPAISGEVQKRGEEVQNGINSQTQNISDNVVKKVENYFSGISNSILHPGENNNCK